MVAKCGIHLLIDLLRFFCLEQTSIQVQRHLQSEPVEVTFRSPHTQPEAELLCESQPGGMRVADQFRAGLGDPLSVRINEGAYPAAYPVACLIHGDSESTTQEVSRHQSRKSTPDDDHLT